MLDLDVAVRNFHIYDYCEGWGYTFMCLSKFFLSDSFPDDNLKMPQRITLIYLPLQGVQFFIDHIGMGCGGVRGGGGVAEYQYLLCICSRYQGRE